MCRLHDTIMSYCLTLDNPKQKKSAVLNHDWCLGATATVFLRKRRPKSNLVRESRIVYIKAPPMLITMILLRKEKGMAANLQWLKMCWGPTHTVSMMTKQHVPCNSISDQFHLVCSLQSAAKLKAGPMTWQQATSQKVVVTGFCIHIIGTSGVECMHSN